MEFVQKGKQDRNREKSEETWKSDMDEGV